MSQRSTRDPDGRRDQAWNAILDAVVDIVSERGVAGASVKLVIARAGVSRRTFYDRVSGLEDCLIAILDRALERTSALVGAAFAREGSWQGGVRGTLAAMLAFFDSESALTRVCIVHTLAAGPGTLAHRERTIGDFRSVLAAHLGADASRALPLAIESTVASVMGMVHARLVMDETEPLIGLLGPLMGLILAPYLDAGELQREIERGNKLARELLAKRAGPSAARPDSPDLEVSRVEIPALLRNSRAERARLCVMYLAEQGRRGVSPSNHQIATAIGIANKGQMSKLLARLERCAILSKISHGVGRPNAWQLTSYGEEIAVHFELRATS